jgi:DNA helicase-2/ATP-dependent DNA helicase PcrA
VENILDFPKEFKDCRVIRLERNYRSTGSILAASTAVVEHNRSRHGKVLWTADGPGDPVVIHRAVDDHAEAEWVVERVRRLQRGTSLANMAVFYRTNAQSRLLEEALRRRRLPYSVIGGMRFYERAEIKDALAYCRLCCNPHDSAAWLRIINTPRRGIGARTIEEVAAFAQARGCSLPAACEAMAGGEGNLRGRERLADFQALLSRLRQEAAGLDAGAAGRKVIDGSGLREALRQIGDIESESRLENLAELLAAMDEHAARAEDPSLPGFLDQVALVADTDSLGDKAEAISLMTMHAAKGLEYDVTFVTGLEEGLVPHATAAREPQGLEEECRLLYVAMTRARRLLHLCLAGQRRRFGPFAESSEPSRFLARLPPDTLRPEGCTWPPGRPGRGGGWLPPAGRMGPVARWSGVSARVRIEHRDDGSRVERDDPPPDPGPVPSGPAFRPGTQVSHAALGRGVVVEVSGQGPEARVTVRFQRAGLRRILARFLSA